VNLRNCNCFWMGRCLWNHGFAMFVDFRISNLICFDEFVFFDYLWNRYVYIFVMLRICELNEYHEYAPLLFLWNHKIIIVVSLRNCGLYECCECSYMLFVKMWNLNYCSLSRFLLLRRRRIRGLFFLWNHAICFMWIIGIVICLKSSSSYMSYFCEFMNSALL
jgi:hypothetical protein